MGAVPGDRREAALDRGYGIGLHAALGGSGGAGGGLEADDVRTRGEGLAPAPGGEMLQTEV